MNLIAVPTRFDGGRLCPHRVELGNECLIGAEEVDKPLHIVEGNMLNYKITLPLDVEIYNRLRNINYD